MPGGITVGSARVLIVPDAERFGSTLRSQVSPIADEIGRAMGSRITDAIRDGVRDGLRNAPTSDAARAGESSGRSFADSFRARVDEALRQLPSVRIEGDTTEVNHDIDEIRARLLALSSARIGVDIDEATAMARLDELRADLDRLSRESPDVEVRANIARAQEQLAAIRGEVDRLDGRRADVDVRVDDHGSLGGLLGGLGGVQAALLSLAPAAIPVGAALVGGIGAVPAIAAAAAGGLGVLALGVSGVAGAVKLLGQEQQAAAKDAAAGAAAAAQQAQAEQTAAAQIRSAQQTLADARKQADRQAIDDAERVKQARQGLADAERDAARQQEDDTARIAAAQRHLADVQNQAAADNAAAAQRVVDAEQQVAQAREQATRQAEDDARRISAAQQNLVAVQQQAAAAQANAYRRVEQAETDYTASVKRVQDAEADLADARRQAQRDLENYADSQVDANLSQQQAEIDLINAQAHAAQVTADATSTDLDRRQAALDVAKAQQSLTEANERLARSTEDNTAAQAAGVDGAPGVVSAHQRISDALAAQAKAAQDVADAQAAAVKAQADGAAQILAAQSQVTQAQQQAARDQTQAAGQIAKSLADLAKAHRDEAATEAAGLRNVQDARAQIAATMQQQTRDQQDSAEKIAKAQQGIADATRTAARDQQDSAERVSRAQAGVASAMQAAAVASTGAGVAGASALAGVQAQLDKVNPATLAFARFWRDDALPIFTRIKAAAAGGLLPGLQAGLEAMRPLVPAITRFVGGLAKVMGDLFTQAGRALTSPFWVNFFSYVSRVAGPYLQTFGRIIGDIAKGFAGLMMAFEPIATAMVRGLGRLGDSFASFGAGASGSSGFQAFLAYVRQEAPVVIDAIKNIGVIVGKLIVGLAPLGALLLKIIDVVAKFLAPLNPNELLAIAAALGVLWAALGGPVTAIVIAITAAVALIVRNWDTIKTAFVDAWDWIRGFVEAHWPLIVGILTGPIGYAVVQIIKHWDAIKGAFSDAWDWVKGFVSDHWVLIVSLLTGPIGAAVIQIVKHWDDITAAFTTAWTWVRDTFAASWNLAKDVLAKPVALARDFFTTLFGESGAVRAAFNAIATWVANTFSAVWAKVKDTLAYPVALARDFFYLVFGEGGPVRTAFSAIATWVSGAFSTTWGAVKDVLAYPVALARDFFYAVFGDKGAVRTAFNAIWTWVSGAFSASWAGVKAIFTKPIDAVVSAVQDAFGSKGPLQTTFRNVVAAVGRIWDGITDALKAPLHVLFHGVLEGGVLAAWNWVADKIPGLGSKAEIHLPKALLQKFAVGGAVTGPGTGTSDDVPAWLSNGEHVWTAREVAAAGGHVQVARLRAAALGNDVAKYATGGEVLARTADFIHSTDPLPYVFGASGPDAYDCSGLVSTVYNMLRGSKDIYQRMFSTSNEGNFFSPGPGAFTVGFTNNASEQHTAASLLGLKFEARDTAEGILVGSSARDPRTFASVMHMPAADALATSANLPVATFASDDNSGKGGGLLALLGDWTSRFTKPLRLLDNIADSAIGKIIAGIPHGIADKMIDVVKGAIAGSGSTNVDPSSNRSLGQLLAAQSPYNWTSGYSNTAQWTPTQRAEWDALNNLFTKESGWSQTADTRATGLDPKNASVFAYGIAQARPASKYPKAGQPEDLGGSSNAGVQIKWGLDYIKGRYSDPVAAWAHEQQFNWYDQGGWLEPGPQLVYNGTGRRELVMPSQTAADIIGTAPSAKGPTTFEGNLYLDSGEFLGRVRGEAHDVVDERVSKAQAQEQRGVPGGYSRHLART